MTDGKDRQSLYQRAQSVIGRAAEAQMRATAKAFRGRRTVGRVLRMMRAALGRTDRVVDKVNELVPPPAPIACGPGCPFCCHIRLTVSPPEVLLVADHLRKTLPADRLEALMRKLANLDNFTRGQDSETRDKMRLPCPMLVDNSCGIHGVRPTSCRAVASVDVAACRRAYDSHFDEPVPQLALQLVAANGIGYGVIAGLRESGYRLENLEFNAALRIALETEDAALRWLEGARIFDPATAKPSPDEDDS